MDLFDFNQHFLKYKQHIFFDDNITYDQLYLDVVSFSSVLSSLKTQNVLALKIQSPYLTFVAILASLKEKKLTVLFSSLESQSMIEKLKTQIHFETIIDDQFVKKNLHHKISLSSFPRLDFNKPAIVVFSSGTTSLPKGVALSFSNLYFSALGFSQYFNQTDKEISLINLPHNHVGGLMILWRAFFSGGSLSSDLSSKIDFISLVPMQLKRMLENIEQLSILKTIRVILIGGAPLTAPLKLLAKSHELILFETYGMSETTSLLMINGEVLPYREVQLDEQNFFNVRGKTLALGYFQNNQLLFFPATSDSSWLKTNDLGFSDELGILHFQERSDLIFVSGGENINPRLIEEAVKMHPLVTDAYLLAITDEHWGEMGILLYESNNQTNVSVQEINQYLKKELHPYQVPKFIYNTILNFQGQLKPNRSQLKRLAYDLYLKNIFSFEYLEKKQAPLIVFFHGFLGNKDDLKEISLHLRDRYSLLYIDLPGHGETNCKNFYSTDDFFKKFADFIRLFSENFIFYGYSMGGRIALNLSLNYLVPTKLILESAGLGLIDENEQHERKESDYNQFLKIDQANLLGFLRRWYTNPIFKTFSEQTSFNLEIEKKSLHDLKQWQMSQTLFSAGCFPTKNKNIEKLKNVSFELLYIYGENDLKYKNYALELQSIKSMALIQTEKIIGAEHNPYKTHPLETIEVLRKKLK